MRSLTILLMIKMSSCHHLLAYILYCYTAYYSGAAAAGDPGGQAVRGHGLPGRLLSRGGLVLLPRPHLLRLRGRGVPLVTIVNDVHCHFETLEINV